MNHSPESKARRRSARKLSVSPWLVALILGVNLALLAGLAWLIWGRNSSGLQLVATPPTQTLATSSPTPEPTPVTPTETPASEPDSVPVELASLPIYPGELPGLVVLARSDGGYTHLFAYHPERLPFTRLTLGDWDDAHPALSPDGRQIAFASNRDGDWEIYLLDLHSGDLRQLTNDLTYQSAPVWSPDGLWLAYEQFINGSLEIVIQPLDGTFDAIQLTFSPGADHSPAWHPDGERIAFVSTSAGQSDIWLAHISRIGEPDYLTNLTRDPRKPQGAPSWSPDGSHLAWSAVFEGHEAIFISAFEADTLTPRYVGPGYRAVWDPTGQYLIVQQRSPDQNYLALIEAANGRYIFPPISIPGRLKGASWGAESLPASLPVTLQTIADTTVTAPWLAELQPGTGIPQRQTAINLNDIRAPYPALNQLATQPFYALRERLKSTAGWDVLGDLENAYVPLTQPLPPYRDNDWLLTGRAFALHSVLIELNWMVVAREDFGGQTYWRIFIKTASQDGSQGQPLTQLPWDFRARFSGDTTAYEEGGAPYENIPSGYWVDFTDLALEYGWQRLPALSTWRTYFPGIRYNIFAVTAGMTWEQAMLEIYPPEIFSQP